MRVSERNESRKRAQLGDSQSGRLRVHRHLSRVHAVRSDWISLRVGSHHPRTKTEVVSLLLCRQSVCSGFLHHFFPGGKSAAALLRLRRIRFQVTMIIVPP